MRLAQKAQHERDDLALLTSSRAGELLRAALARRGRVHLWRIHQIHHRPGAGICVGYSITFSDNSTTYALASTATIDEHALADMGGSTLCLDKHRVHVWEYPFDPELPALPLASNARKLGALLDGLLGMEVNIELLSYRPTRRAVMRVEGNGELYAKVVRPSAQADLVQRLQLLEDSGVPGPRLVRGKDGRVLTERGLVLTHAAEGVPLSRFYADFTPSRIGEADQMLEDIVAALDSLPKTAMLFPRKAAWADRCEHYAHAAALSLPNDAHRAHNVAAEIRYLLNHSDLGDVTAVHGDFYEANVLVDLHDGSVTSLLDVDSLGPGYRVHDWGCLLGHLAVLPSLAPKRYRYAETLCSHWFDELSSHVDPVALCASTAGVVLSLVAGARKKRRGRSADEGVALAQQRLSVAEEWVAAGRSILLDPHYSATVIPLHR